jgi:hypothetical protein
VEDQKTEGSQSVTNYCTISDAAGDQAYLSFKCEGDGIHCHGPFEYIAGTGKYAGITGSNRAQVARVDATKALGALSVAHGRQVMGTPRCHKLSATWSRLGHEIGFGIGIAHGFATLGTIGFEGRFDYAAIGTVSNVASRLCDKSSSVHECWWRSKIS